MATVIFFTANDVAILVKEEPDEVAQAVREAHDQTLQLTIVRNEKSVWINPRSIAYWHEGRERTGSASF